MKLPFLAAAAVLLTFCSLSFGQSCRGSNVTYLVREAKGNVVDAASTTVRFSGGDSAASKNWKVGPQEFASKAVTLPPSLAPINGAISGLTTSQSCNFTEAAVLRVTMEGNTMELKFNFPTMGEHESAEFLVDSKPFKAGKYEITLARPEGSGAYYPASGWKKLP
jgi:hypothetical protein